MAKQKINAQELYPKDDFVKVVPTTKQIGIYTVFRYLYTDDKDVNDWYRLKKYLLKAAWKEVLSCENYNPCKLQTLETV